MKYISAAEFKAKCLKLMDEVQQTGESLTITKRGKPVAVLAPVETPVERPRTSLFGSMRGSVIITGDIVGPIDPDWEAEWEANNPAELYRRP